MDYVFLCIYICTILRNEAQENDFAVKISMHDFVYFRKIELFCEDKKELDN